MRGRGTPTTEGRYIVPDLPTLPHEWFCVLLLTRVEVGYPTRGLSWKGSCVVSFDPCCHVWGSRVIGKKKRQRSEFIKSLQKWIPGLDPVNLVVYVNIEPFTTSRSGNRVHRTLSVPRDPFRVGKGLRSKEEILPTLPHTWDGMGCVGIPVAPLVLFRPGKRPLFDIFPGSGSRSGFSLPTEKSPGSGRRSWVGAGFTYSVSPTAGPPFGRGQCPYRRLW